MNEEEIKLSDLFSIKNNIFVIFVPLVSDKRNYFEQLIKFTPVLKYNSKLVTLEKEDNEYTIGYDELKAKNETMNNAFFVIFDYNVLIHYDTNIINNKNNNNNKFIILLSILEIDKYQKDNIYLRKPITLFGKNFDLPIDIDIITRKSYILAEQLKYYNKAYLKNKQLGTGLSNNNDALSNLLNIYFDEKITSLDNISLEKAIQRSPKFKTIILDILLKNKKRHLINMEDGKYGIDSFLTIYNKIKDAPVIIVLKKSDDYNKKLRKLQTFNETNAPGVIISDFNFSDNMMPKNLDYFHITDGGGGINKRVDILHTFYEQCHAKNYSGSYPRKLELISHISVTTGNEITINLENNNNLLEEFTRDIRQYNLFKKLSQKIYLKGDELYLSIKK